MKKFITCRVLPLFLSLVLLIPCFVVPADAALVEAASILSVVGDTTAVMQFGNSLRSFFNGQTTADPADWHMSTYLASGMSDELDYYFRQETLEDLAEEWNLSYSQYGEGFFAQVGLLGNGYGCVYLVPDGDQVVDARRVLCNSDHVPILCENYESGAGRVDGALPDKWVPDVDTYLNLGNLLSYEDLYNKAVEHDGIVLRVGEYYLIYSKARDKVLADPSGLVYKSRYDNGKWAAGSDRGDDGTVLENGVVVEGDVEGNVTNIDLGDMTLTLPDGSINFIDKIIYDESTKTYHIDAHDEYNTTINNYYTWNYYINYTSITYIGQTEEYNKYYEVYYELPDGRDSADLTKEELEQLNLSIDVIPYGRSADDTSLRSLYHFDGDTRDSSYWNYCTDFTWNTGASLTYMDAGVFEGALYLDETEHDFTFTLPSMLSAQDFTLQFRYYQSNTLAPVTDSYIQLGSSTVLQMSGGYFSNAAGTQLATTPVGSWNEIALIRDSGTIYIYLNGVCIGSEANTTAFDNTITFHFGDEQQTFKYFDELRVLNYALQTGGANYECTSVPHDTNLALVLPDSALPVADEYWDWDTTIEPVWAEDFTIGYNDVFKTSSFSASNDCLGNVYYDANTRTSVIQNVGSTILQDKNSAFWDDDWRNFSSGGGLCIPISFVNGSTYYDIINGQIHPAYSDFKGKQLTFTLVDVSGEFYSLTFEAAYPSSWCSALASASFDWGTIYYQDIKINNGLTHIWILPNQGSSVEFVYAELVEGDTPNVNHEWVESVTILDKEDLHNPTLAVRTDLDITSYQIGGVRPSVPTKGQVWALVENERIVSIQIYNGQAWEGVDGRIWTGSRWIPASSYNIVTLQDMYDIVDATPDFEYIYTESGFWSWWQKSWNAFTDKLFKVLGSGGTGSGGGCQHAYAITAETDATCTDPGERTYTCALCDNQYVESVPALGHDWIQKEETPTTYALPEGTACPDCAGLDYAAELDEDSATYSCTCNSCGTVWTVQAEVTEGETLYTCSRCGETTTETDKENEGFFDALGNFLADGVEWVTDRLKQLVDSLNGLNQIFSDYVKTIREKAGEYPAFLSAAIAFLPEDLMAVFWFSVVAFVLLAVWKKWLR